MEQAADEAGVKDAANSFKAAADPKKMGLDKLNEATESFRKWQPGSETAKLAEDRAAAARKAREDAATKPMASAGDDPGAIAEAPKAATAAPAAPRPRRRWAEPQPHLRTGQSPRREGHRPRHGSGDSRASDREGSAAPTPS